MTTSYLLKPLNAHGLQLKNRLIMPPMATGKSGKNNSVSKELLDYYDEKTKGGHFSLVILEHCYVQEDGRTRAAQLSISKDEDISGLKELAEVIHNNGSKCVAQINHAGGMVYCENISPPVSPSGIQVPGVDCESKAMTIEDILQVIESFAQAAVRAKKAGFDGVEVHSAHGYLLNQFYSPITNKRADSYGGNVHKRIKIHLQIIKAIREAVGDSYPVLLRLGASDYMEGGATIEDGVVAAAEFKEAGISILDVSGGLCQFDPKFLSGQGYFYPLTQAIKQKVDIPVILTGGITEVKAAETLLQEGKADLIGVGRAVLKDSSWAHKAMESLIANAK